MTLFQTFRALPQRTRISLGLAFLAWGTLGLYISDRAEKKLGFEASDTDKQALNKMLPKVEVVERS